MARTSDADILVEIAKEAQYSFELLSITVGTPTGSETVYINNGSHDVVYDGNTYTSLGQFLSIGDIQETGELQINTVSVGISAIPNTIVNLFFNYNYIDRPIRVYRAYFKQSGGSLDNGDFLGAILIFDGRMDKPVLQDDPNGTSIVAIEARNNWADYERKGGRHTNHDEHQFFFPGDMGMEFSSQVVQDLKWGG